MPGLAYGSDAMEYDHLDRVTAQPFKDNVEVHIEQKLYASPPAFHNDSAEVKEANSLSVSSKPTASLVSPPTSLADEIDVVPDGEAITSVEGDISTELHTPNSSSRHSSRQPRQGDRFLHDANASRVTKPPTKPAPSAMRRTPGPPPSAKKPSSRPSSSYAKKSSPMAERRFERHATTSLSPHQSKYTNHFANEEGPDTESLRLIRELQEEEFGLRRRRG